MKKAIRAIIFSMAAIYLTSLWNYGFSFNRDPISILKTSLIIGVVFYLILPFLKIILLPLNIISLGLASLFVYFILLHFLNYLSVISIKAWDFYGLSFTGLIIPKTTVNYSVNLFLTATSISTIINFLELLL